MVHSAEGVTQGDPLGMIFYCFGQLRALRELQTKYPKATVFAYADDVFLFFSATITHTRKNCWTTGARLQCGRAAPR